MNLFQNKKLTIFLLSSLLIIVIAILFFPNLFGRKKVNAPAENPEITQIKTQSKDNSVESIKNDLNNTDVNNIYGELDSIDKELNASI